MAQARRSFHAPGRVNLIGEHTDHSGGLVLPAAIERGITLTGRTGGDRIVLRSDRESEGVDVAADGADAPTRGWGRYVAAVAHELALLGRPPVGLAGEVASDLPDGAGLSSSAALEVVVATALCAVAGHPLAALELAAVAQRAEQRAVGVPCGIMDQAASLLGRADCAILLDCGALTWRAVPLPPDLAVVVIDSGVRRRLEHSGYARRLQELRPGLEALAGAGLTPAQVAPAALEEVLAGARLDPVSVRRLRHVVTENARVLAVERALGVAGPPRQARGVSSADDLFRSVGDDTAQPAGGAGAGGVDARRKAWDDLGRLFAEGHASLRDDFEVSVPELDLLVALAVDAGAVAARMTGGGFGGAVVVLAERGEAEALAAEVVGSYAGGSHRHAEVLVTRAAEGAREIS